MQKCSLCGGKVVNGRCEDCGMPIPPENRYTLRGETVHTYQVNGEKVLHRERQRRAPDKKPAYSHPAKSPAGTAKTPRTPQPRYSYRTLRGDGAQQKKPLADLVWGIILLVLLFNVLPVLITSCSA